MSDSVCVNGHSKRDRPKWVPEWVWDGYQYIERFHFRCEGDDLTGLNFNSHKVTAAIIFSEDCGKDVWPAMERRLSTAKSRWRKKLTRTSHHIKFEPASALFIAVLDGVRGLSPVELISGSERKTRGTRIAWLAAELRSELEDLDADHNTLWLPPEFVPPLEKVAEDAAIRSLKGVVVDSSEMSTEDIERIGHYSSGVDEGSMATILELSPIFDAIEAGAIAWSQSQPVVFRPNDQGAERLYFVRHVTEYFREYFGTPLRGQTAALANCLYPGDLDGPTVAKLAP